MAKSRKSNSRTRRVYRKKSRINKKRRLTRRKAGCSPTTAAKCAAVGVGLVLARPKPPPRDLGFSRYEGRVESPVAPCANRMSRSSRREDLAPLRLPHDIGGVYRTYNTPPTKLGLSRRR